MRIPISDIIVLRRVGIFGPSSSAYADLLLDTGAALTTLSRSVLQVAGYDVENLSEQQKIVTGNGVVLAPIVRVHKLQLLDLEVQDLLVCVHDIPEVAHVEGLIGVNFLKHFRTVIDFPAGYLDIS